MIWKHRRGSANAAGECPPKSVSQALLGMLDSDNAAATLAWLLWHLTQPAVLSTC